MSSKPTLLNSIGARIKAAATPTNQPTSKVETRVERIPYLAKLDTTNLHEMQNRGIAEIIDGKSLIREGDIGQAVTTPILGQYAGTFGWPDDWAFYWDYLDAVMLVPEVKFAVNLKNRMIWRSDFDVVGKDGDEADRVEEELRELELQNVFMGLTWNALVTGNGYAEIVDDSEATWKQQDGSRPMNGSDNIVARTILDKYTKPTELYGFKAVDPRTMRIEADPFHFDRTHHDVAVIKYIQRIYQGPLSIALIKPTDINNEKYFTSDQVIHLRFNRILHGLYGYSTLRETFYPLKAYLVMIQFIPIIFFKRADPALLIKFGGEVVNEMGQKETWWPSSEDEFQKYKNRFLNRDPAQDFFGDVLTNVEEIYKHQGPLNGLEKLLQVWRERIMMGLGVPPVLSETRVGGVRWGDLKFETLVDEIREYQFEVERVVNKQIIPRLTRDKSVRFKFNKIMPDDWMAMSRAALPIVQFGGANWPWFRKLLNIPEEAAEGAAPLIGLSANPLSGGIGGFTSNPNRTKSPNASTKTKGSKLSKPKDEQPKTEPSNPKGKN